MTKGTAKDFGRGRRTSAKAAELYAQEQARKARERAATRAAQRRNGGKNLAAQSAAWQGKPKPKPPPGPKPPSRPKSLAAQSAAHKRKQANRRRPAKPRKPNPGGYRADDPRYQARSPWYAIGHEDATTDCEIVANCPPGTPLGPDPGRSWSHMYRRGYDDQIVNAVPHKCTKECRNNATA